MQIESQKQSGLEDMTLIDFIHKHVNQGNYNAVLVIEVIGLNKHNSYSKYHIRSDWLLEELKKAKELDSYKTLELK